VNRSLLIAEQTPNESDSHGDVLTRVAMQPHALIARRLSSRESSRRRPSLWLPAVDAETDAEQNPRTEEVHRWTKHLRAALVVQTPTAVHELSDDAPAQIEDEVPPLRPGCSPERDDLLRPEVQRHDAGFLLDAIVLLPDSEHMGVGLNRRDPCAGQAE